jgi:diguanylate cyclase (GGDEF)-like protein
MTLQYPPTSPGAEDPRTRLLVVDDQPDNVRALYHALNAEHQVLVATGGAQALAMAADKQPALILLDVVMPDLDGHEVCRRLKADPRTADIPVIFVSAGTEEADETQGLDAGAVDYIGKPISPAIVRARVRTHLTLKRQSDQLRELAYIDGLSGVANRRSFDERLQQEWARAAREDQPVSLILIDIDAFKAFNDRYGHQAGDEALRRVARQLQATLARPADLVARYGGEEFACLLPATDALGALSLAQRMERQLRHLGIPHAASPVAPVLTISLGVSTQVPLPRMALGPEAEALVTAADRALYRAKQTGRGRACTAADHADGAAAEPQPLASWFSPLC